VTESRKPHEVEHLLEQRASSGRSGAQELVFDPTTGQLVVTNNPSPDAVVASQATDDGYFG
jgi:hypothetical protein